jgi:hypothetical protein
MWGWAWTAVAAALVAGCAAPVVVPEPEPVSTTGAGFGAPPTSDVLRRVLRTDLCALLDEAVVTELGWVRGTPAQTLTACVAASPDQARSVTMSVDTSVSEVAAPATGNRCTRQRIVDRSTMIALMVHVRDEPDPCATADRFLGTAVTRFEAGVGAVEPPHPWIALDACEVLPPLLPAAVDELGPARSTLREVRRLGLRGCIATHEQGEVTLSVEPAAGAVADLDGDEVAVGGHPGRMREFGSTCVVRLIGAELGIEGQPGRQTQVITIEVSSGQVAAAQRCAAASEVAGGLVESW